MTGGEHMIETMTRWATGLLALTLLLTPGAAAQNAAAAADEAKDLRIVNFSDVMTPDEAKTAGFFEHEGRWLPKKLKKKVKKWVRLDKKHGEWKTARRFSSKHYRIVSNLPSHVLENEIAPYVDAMFKAYSELYKRDFGVAAKAVDNKFIYVHKSIEDYALNTGGRTVEQARYNPGFIRGGSELVVYHDDRYEDTFFNTVMHEGAHQFVMALYPGAAFPTWIHEGLATYFEGCTYSRSRQEFEVGFYPIDRLVSAQMSLKERPDDDIGKMFMDVSDARFGAGEYALAWSFIYFLNHAEKGKYRKAFRTFLKDMNGAGVKYTPSQIFARSAKIEFKDLDEAWREYVLALPVDSGRRWVRVENTEGAESAGLKAYDAITHVNGEAVRDAAHFAELWSKRDQGEPVDIIVQRGQRFDVTRAALRIPSNIEMPEVKDGRTRAGCLVD